jgi:hypothetical protein
MGVGYATWNQILDVNLNLSVAPFNVEFVKSFHAGVLTEPNAELINRNGMSAPYVGCNVLPDLNGSHVSNVHELQVNFTNLYPGVQMNIPFEMKNTGNIPVIYDSVVISFDSENQADPNNAALKNYLELGGIISSSIYNENGEYKGGNLLLITPGTKLNNLQLWIHKLLKNYILQAGDYLRIASEPTDPQSIQPYFSVKLPWEITDKNISGHSVVFKIKINWKQLSL